MMHAARHTDATTHPWPIGRSGPLLAFRSQPTGGVLFHQIEIAIFDYPQPVTHEASRSSDVR